MARKLTFKRQSDDEELKQKGMFLDLDEIAKKGSLSGGDVNIAKWYGYYTSRQPGTHMVRVVLPGGILTSSQARNIADVSEDYGQGIVNVTTRQALQLHWLKAGNLADVVRDLRAGDNSTKHGCGDVTRNVAACPLAECCEYRRVNARDYAIATAEFLGNCTDLENLPRKFKINFSGCGADCGQSHINCVGLMGVKTGGKTGFKVVIGGGLGWKGFIAQPLFGFVPKEKVLQVTRAVALLFREHGDRFNRAKSRLKFVVHRQGIEACRDIVLANLKAEGVDASDLIVEPVQDEGVPYPNRPLTKEAPVASDGTSVVRVFIPKGEFSFSQLKQFAAMSEVYADQRLYTTNRQNIEFHGVEASDVKKLKSEIEEMGFATKGNFGLNDIVSCVGTTYCPKAVSETRVLVDALTPLVNQPKYREIEKQAIINISGCPNSCSQFPIADIGYRGLRIREMEGSVEGYQITLGGTLNSFGEKLGDFKLEDCAAVTELVLNDFLKIQKSNETLSDCVKRVGISHFKKVVYDAV